MAADVELLPLPKHSGKATDMFGQKTKLYSGIQMQDYARANVAHATAAKDAEIAHERWLREQAENRCVAVEDQREALRAKVAEWRQAAITQSGEMFREKDRAERLAEALREAMSELEAREGDYENIDWLPWWNDARALLREQEEGK